MPGLCDESTSSNRALVVKWLDRQTKQTYRNLRLLRRLAPHREQSDDFLDGQS